MTPNSSAQRGDLSPRIQQAIHEVPRDAFLVHEDRYLQLVVGRTMPPPTLVGRILEALELTPNSRVLQVGTGSGYVAAIISRVVARVHTIERLPVVVSLARQRIASLGYTNIEIKTGNGFRGWPEHAPFDAIHVQAKVRSENLENLKKQLAIGGRMIYPQSQSGSVQRFFKLVRRGVEEFDGSQLELVEPRGDAWNILVDMGVLRAELVARAKLAAEQSGRAVEDEIRALAPLDENDLYRALAIQYNLKYGETENILSEIDPELFRQLPRAFLDHHRLIPFSRRGNTVRVATCDPEVATSNLAKAFPGLSIELCLVTPTNFRRIWAALDLMQRTPQTAEVPPPPEVSAEQIAAGGAGSVEAHAVVLFETIVLDAIGERASDIHLERYGDKVRLRLRVDGELRDITRFSFTPQDLSGLVNVVKVRAGLDITEHRLPQGGRLRLRDGNQFFDLRVQTQPCLHGEHIILRLLPHDRVLLTIEDLGLPSEVAEQYGRLLTHPAGLVLVVGPTGSGKSTTLYAGLRVLAQDSKRKVLTIEDPIEYSMDGVQQSQVRPDLGFDFADAVRAFLRQDPDVILLGEIRDHDTALEAIRASQTGHLVLSTLHCNDAIDAVQRLYDLGMHPNSIAGELLAVLAQRLAKRICDNCRTQVEPDAAIMAELHEPPGAFTCYQGVGCARCNGRGTIGRVAVVEFLRLGPEMRRAIARQLPLDDLRHAALNSGLITMRDSALGHVKAGRIPLSELPRILAAERMAPERVA